MTYIGGKEANKHELRPPARGYVAPWARPPSPGSRTARRNQVSAGARVARTDGPTLRTFVWERTVEGAQVYTDDASAYVGLAPPAPVRQALRWGATWTGKRIRTASRASGPC